MERKQILIRLKIDIHEKLRWLAYKQNKSITEIINETLEEALKEVKAK